MKIFNWAYDIFKSFDFSDALSSYLNLAINIVVLIVVAYILDYLFKKLFIIFLAIVAAKTKSSFDDFLVANKTAKYLALLSLASSSGISADNSSSVKGTSK